MLEFAGFLITRFPMQWHPYSRASSQISNRTLKPWLQDTGSLTKRLTRLSGGQFHVQLLRQNWGRVRRDEALALGIPFSHRCLIREVLLHGNSEAWVYARSIIPASSLRSSLQFLKRLGNKPLGALLFSDPSMHRNPIEVTLMKPNQLPVLVDHVCWGRRSVFFLSEQPLLVSETFLPAFLSVINV